MAGSLIFLDEIEDRVRLIVKGKLRFFKT